MDRDVRLFFATAALTFGGLGVTQAGWTNTILVWSPFGAAGVSLLAATFWGPFSRRFPKTKEAIARIASNRISWFVLVFSIFGLVFALDLAIRMGWIGNTPIKNATIPAAQATGERLEPIIGPKNSGT
jgi:hypothetical protein